MRPGQSNKRSRGRGRKGPSPLSRSYESNGPDVKIRGTAQHVADKYINLARDAQSSGDTVLSEAYFQHAEHYYRIVAAAQLQMNQPVNVRRADDPIDTSEGEDDDDKEAFDPSDPDAPQPDFRNQANGRQGPRNDDDGERRGRRGRSRGRRGRDDFRADEQGSANQRSQDGATDGGADSTPASSNGAAAPNGDGAETGDASAVNHGANGSADNGVQNAESSQAASKKTDAPSETDAQSTPADAGPQGDSGSDERPASE